MTHELSREDADLADEVATEQAAQVMQILRERNLLAKTTPRYDRELEDEIVSVLAEVLDDTLDFGPDDDEEEDEEEPVH